ncbi:hypothetical protein ACNKF0_01890 [Nocardioides sp. T5]|uniref:hypothetical protein n=1 Tax=Nocardioides sp. T5 TaxID=3400182 RepID=UPI003A89CEB2
MPIAAKRAPAPVRPRSPHLFKHSTLVPATPEQIEENGLCTHCEKEVRGEGRTYVDDLDEAIRRFGHRTDVARRLILEALGDVPHDAVWIPASESYIALGHDGQAVAWVGKGYVEVKGRPVVEAPVVPGSGSRRAHLPRRGSRSGQCEVHFVEKSMVGDCEMCD